ncbi:MAG: hypothetical protein U0Q16_21270 [Bryobacteraceae bacterium]
MQRKFQILTMVLAAGAMLTLGSDVARGGTFGKVVPIGGHAADLALDEARGVLYIANYTANRIEIMSLADGSIQTSMNVTSQPSSLTLSADGRYLVIGHYGNFTAAGSSNNALTVIDLTTKARQTFSLGAPVLGVAFGADDRVLVVTSKDFELFDPVSGATVVLDTVTGLTVKDLPAENPNPPSSLVAASMGAAGDMRTIYGLTDKFTFRYDVDKRLLSVQGYTSEPTMGPRAVSVNTDGSLFVSGWVLRDAAGTSLAQYPGPNGALEVGSHAIDSLRQVIYSEVPTDKGTVQTIVQAPAVLQVVDWTNLAVKEKINLPEHLTGRSVINSANSVMYAISQSGVVILPVGALDQAPRVTATVEDVVFRSNFCDRRAITQEIGIINPGGGPADFQLSTTTPGIRISPASGVTPATVRISVDPSAFQNIKGTLSAQIDIKSTAAVNNPNPVRVLINNREPDQRGTVVNVPGKLVDLVADPQRDRFFVLRQDTNEVLVYDGTTNALVARLKTGNTPTQMAVTFDRRYLLVGHENSQILTMYDLETLETLPYIAAPRGHYPRSVAASGKAILVASRVAGPVNMISQIDMVTRRAVALTSLGVYKNDIHQTTTLVATPNGGKVMGVASNGAMLLYDANVDSFTISRRDQASLGGAIAASNFDQFVVGNRLLNASLVTVASFDANLTTSGFAFVDQAGLRTVTADTSSPGVIQRVEMEGRSARATRIAESPVTGTADFPFTRSLAPLYSRTALVNLTVSGFTVLPWTYDTAVASPRIDRVVNAADGSGNIATGGLVSLFGQNLSPVNLATRELPLPTALGDSCLTVNGVPAPMMFVSPAQINAQIPYQVDGNVTVILRTPGGISDNFNLLVRPTAPSVFRSPQDPAVSMVVRDKNGELATLSNPLHRGDRFTIYLTGMGRTNPPIEAGVPAPGSPLLPVLTAPVVRMGGDTLDVTFAGLSPGQIGVYRIDSAVPGYQKTGVGIPLEIVQGGASTAIDVRVVE